MAGGGAPPPPAIGGLGASAGSGASGAAGAIPSPPKPADLTPKDENKSPPVAAAGAGGAAGPAGTEEHSRFIPALGPPRAEDGTPLRPTPSGSPPPPAGAGAPTIPPPADLGVTPAGSKVEPVGATPRAIAPAIQAGAPLIPRADKSPPATAKSYAVTRYVCQAGDTFQSLSKQYYRREDFAAALQAFNRVDSHRCGSPALSSDGKLSPGDVVYVPMLAALEGELSGYLPKPETTPASYPGP
jgi:hypothetical protein